MKAERQTGNALAAAAEATIPYLQPTLDEIQVHRIALKSRVTLEGRALM